MPGVTDDFRDDFARDFEQNVAVTPAQKGKTEAGAASKGKVDASAGLKAGSLRGGQGVTIESSSRRDDSASSSPTLADLAAPTVNPNMIMDEVELLQSKLSSNQLTTGSDQMSLDDSKMKTAVADYNKELKEQEKEEKKEKEKSAISKIVDICEDVGEFTAGVALCFVPGGQVAGAVLMATAAINVTEQGLTGQLGGKALVTGKAAEGLEYGAMAATIVIGVASGGASLLASGATAATDAGAEGADVATNSIEMADLGSQGAGAAGQAADIGGGASLLSSSETLTADVGDEMTDTSIEMTDLSGQTEDLGGGMEDTADPSGTDDTATGNASPTSSATGSAASGATGDAADAAGTAQKVVRVAHAAEEAEDVEHAADLGEHAAEIGKEAGETGGDDADDSESGSDGAGSGAGGGGSDIEMTNLDESSQIQSMQREFASNLEDQVADDAGDGSGSGNARNDVDLALKSSRVAGKAIRAVAGLVMAGGSIVEGISDVEGGLAGKQADDAGADATRSQKDLNVANLDLNSVLKTMQYQTQQYEAITEAVNDAVESYAQTGTDTVTQGYA